ncbi:MAG TPA: hypothetical protein VF796_22830 [Humisphaera sp.]
MNNRRRSSWPLVLAGVTLVAVAVSTYLRYIEQAVTNAYAVWTVADIVVTHLEQNDDRWPRDWDDLRAAARLRTNNDAVDLSYWSARVEIDFAADPKALAAAPFDPGRDVRPFNVIRHRQWPGTWYVEPNARVWAYLNRPRPASKPSATRPATAPAG